LAVVVTLTKGYDLDYIWRQVDRSAIKDAAGYYIQASESGGDPPGRWWGPGAEALCLEHGQTVESEPYDLLLANASRQTPPLSRLSRQRAERRRHLHPPAGRRTARNGRLWPAVSAPNWPAWTPARPWPPPSPSDP
jgi:hypothetical protein